MATVVRIRLFPLWIGIAAGILFAGCSGNGRSGKPGADAPPSSGSDPSPSGASDSSADPTAAASGDPGNPASQPGAEPAATVADNMTCAYNGALPHPCACADGKDNDGDGKIDGDDLQCFGPFDDDEGSFATGIPGDNNGSNANRECPFDGNSGPGNDGVCCNLADPSQNLTPNGCDNRGCCEVDVNGNGTGEHVYIGGECRFNGGACGADGKLGCPCATSADCGSGLQCVKDDDTGAGFCAACQPCVPDATCENTCACGELCFGGFQQPASQCGNVVPPPGGGGGTLPSCPTGPACPAGNADCAANERCTSGCCVAQCASGVTACQIGADCPADSVYWCITGCCVEAPM